jgi:biotin carboxylase
MAMREAGVRVPDTLAIGGEGELEQALGETGFPAVLKSDGSWGGEGVAIVRDRAAAITAYRRLSEPPSRLRCLARAARRRDTHFVIEAWAPLSRTMSLQRFIPGTPAASAFAAWRGTVTGSICYDVLVADGDIGPPSVIRRVDDREMEFASAAAAERFGLSGLHGLDFIRDADGQVHLLEINPRATLGGTLAFGRGRDLPACLAAAAFGSASGMRPAIVNDTVVMFPREWQRSPSSEWIRSGHHDVPWDDPDVFRAALGAPVARRRA